MPKPPGKMSSTKGKSQGNGRPLRRKKTNEKESRYLQSADFNLMKLELDDKKALL